MGHLPPYPLLADLALMLHVAFILFAVLGGVAVLRWPRLAWLHLPAAVWATAVELCGWFCPLTDLENDWRRRAGEGGYQSSFIDHYLTPLIYPDGLSRELQIGLGLCVLVLNLLIYRRLLHRRKQQQTPERNKPRR